MNKLEKLELEERRAREKIADIQELIKKLAGKRTEQENLQIVKQIRALNLSRDELYAFLESATLPASLTEVMPKAAPDPETIYSRRERKRRIEQEEPEVTESEETGNEA
jgi:hypothetical protein